MQELSCGPQQHAAAIAALLAEKASVARAAKALKHETVDLLAAAIVRDLPDAGWLFASPPSDSRKGYPAQILPSTLILNVTLLSTPKPRPLDSFNSESRRQLSRFAWMPASWTAL